MELKHISEIDTKKWDLAFAKSLGNPLYSNLIWLQFVCPDFYFLIDKNYQNVLPVPLKSKMGFKYVVQPLLTQYLIPKFETESIEIETIELVKSKFKFIRFNLLSKMKADKFKIDENQNFILPLNDDFNTISLGFSNQLKRNLKKANPELQFSKSENLVEIIDLFKNNAGKKFGIKRNFFEKLYALKSLQNIDLECYSAKIENDLQAGLLLIKCGNHLTSILTAQSEIGKTNFALTALFRHIIKIYSNSQFVLDFEGSNNPGIARFYASFGSKPENYYSYQYRFGF